MSLHRITTAQYGLPHSGGVAVTTAPPATADSTQRGFDVLRRRITLALTEVRSARASYVHCPSGENAEIIEAAEHRLNALLADQRLRAEETT